MTCRDCLHYLDSHEANKPRTGLDGFGYCKAGTEPEMRAQFFHESKAVCLLYPSAFQRKRNP